MLSGESGPDAYNHAMSVIDAICSYPVVAMAPSNVFRLWEERAIPGLLDRELAEAEDCSRIQCITVLVPLSSSMDIR